MQQISIVKNKGLVIFLHELINKDKAFEKTGFGDKTHVLKLGLYSKLFFWASPKVTDKS
jgi:hypothetical protein